MPETRTADATARFADTERADVIAWLELQKLQFGAADDRELLRILIRGIDRGEHEGTARRQASQNE